MLKNSGNQVCVLFFWLDAQWKKKNLVVVEDSWYKYKNNIMLSACSLD